MADAKQGEALAAQAVHCIVSSEVSLYKVLSEKERPALLLPGAREPFSVAFASFFQTVYAQLCLGQDPCLARELEAIGAPLEHTVFCTLSIVARVCDRVRSRLDRSKLRIESKEAYIKSLHEQAEPIARQAALAVAKHRHKCKWPDIRKMDPDQPVFAPKKIGPF